MSMATQHSKPWARVGDNTVVEGNAAGDAACRVCRRILVRSDLGRKEEPQEITEGRFIIP